MDWGSCAGEQVPAISNSNVFGWLGEYCMRDCGHRCGKGSNPAVSVRAIWNINRWKGAWESKIRHNLDLQATEATDSWQYNVCPGSRAQQRVWDLCEGRMSNCMCVNG